MKRRSPNLETIYSTPDCRMATSHDGDEEHGYSAARPVPEHLGNEDTMIKLGFIDELKGLGINELVNLPQVRLIFRHRLMMKRFSMFDLTDML